MAGPQWIDSLLRQVDQSNNGTSSFHRQFSEFFSSLDVKTLPYPTSNIKDLADLSSLPSSELDQEYLKSVKALLEHILVLADPKKIGKLQMTGPALANLVEKWTENMNVPIGDYRSNSAEELLGHIMYFSPFMNSPMSFVSLSVVSFELFVRAAEVSRATVKYSDLLSKLFQGVMMSEQEIRNVSDQIISEIAGPDPAYQYVNAINNAVAPLLAGNIQVHVSTKI